MANIDAGINKTLFEQIKKATEKMKTEHKLCIILFDEMSLKPNVAYNERKDMVSGFVTNGEERQPIYADHAQEQIVKLTTVSSCTKFSSPVARAAKDTIFENKSQILHSHPLKKKMTPAK
ncbi:unnamed protein product, partial [Brenthis ino]